jgi:hypothetical protein
VLSAAESRTAALRAFPPLQSPRSQVGSSRICVGHCSTTIVGLCAVLILLWRCSKGPTATNGWRARVRAEELVHD